MPHADFYHVDFCVMLLFHVFHVFYLFSAGFVLVKVIKSSNMNFILDPDAIMLLSRQAQKCDGSFLSGYAFLK